MLLGNAAQVRTDFDTLPSVMQLVVAVTTLQMKRAKALFHCEKNHKPFLDPCFGAKDTTGSQQGAG